MELDFTSLIQSIRALRRSIEETTPLLSSLSPAMAETVKAGIIQHFEVAYEQCWKSMKRWIETNVSPESADGVNRRELFRLAAESKLITDVDLWMVFHQARNKTSHTYNATTAHDVLNVAISFCPEAERFADNIVRHND